MEPQFFLCRQINLTSCDRVRCEPDSAQLKPILTSHTGQLREVRRTTDETGTLHLGGTGFAAAAAAIGDSIIPKSPTKRTLIVARELLPLHSLCSVNHQCHLTNGCLSTLSFPRLFGPTGSGASPVHQGPVLVELHRPALGQSRTGNPNGVRRPRQICGPKIRANVPPKGSC